MSFVIEFDPEKEYTMVFTGKYISHLSCKKIQKEHPCDYLPTIKKQLDEELDDIVSERNNHLKRKILYEHY